MLHIFDLSKWGLEQQNMYTEYLLLELKNISTDYLY